MNNLKADQPQTTRMENQHQMQCTTKDCEGQIKDGLCQVCQAGQSGVPSNNYHSWQSRAELLIATLRQLEKREIEVDPANKVLGIPIFEEALRDAAEEALRHCAHFATSSEDRISLIDQANSVRRTTWF